MEQQGASKNQQEPAPKVSKHEALAYAKRLHSLEEESNKCTAHFMRFTQGGVKRLKTKKAVELKKQRMKRGLPLGRLSRSWSACTEWSFSGTRRLNQ